MSDPIGSFSGLASGIQWRDLVDQIVAVEKQRKLDPVTTRKSLEQKRLEAWTSFNALATKFRDAQKTLRDTTAFAAFKVTAGDSPTSGRALLSGTAAIGAQPGAFSVEVLDLAKATKLSGSIVSSSSAALGFTGDFGINGKQVTVTAADSISAIRDKINALNSGSTPTGVSATVLSTGTAQHRLVLTADQTGAGGVELTDGIAGVLQSLGVVDATSALNLTESGGVQSYRVSSATAALATMLGVTMPAPSSIIIGGRTIAVDLTVDSLTTIAARISAAGGNAQVVTETRAGKTSSRLVTSDTVSASTPDGQRTLEVMGLVTDGRSGIAQVVTSENIYTDAADAPGTAATLLTSLKVNGNPLGIAAGDTFAIQGKRGDGTAVSVSFVVGGADTLQTALNKLNDATSGFGAGSRTATASLVGGKIVLTDGTAGDSQLALSMSVTQAVGGTTIALGNQQATTVGRLRQVVSGSDAQLRVDGVVLRRASNTITDALAGVTLNLQQAEVGSTVALTIARDLDAIAKTVGEVATAYNELVKFRTAQSVADAPLRGNVTLRGAISTLTNALLTNVSGTSSAFTRAGQAGLALQRDGTLLLDTAVLKTALQSSFSDVVTLFATSGTSANPDIGYYVSTEKSRPGTYAVDITSLATVASLAGAGFGGTYTDDATADTLTLTDASSGATGNISLANGDTTDTIVAKLNALFAASKMTLSATKNGNNVSISGSQFGSSATFTLAYTAGGADGSAQLGLAAGTYAGTNVAGTIGGLVATGNGQFLTGVAGGDTEGLAIRYSGTTLGAVGSLAFVTGLAATLYNAADVVARPGGSINNQTDTISASITSLETRADTISQALERRRQALVKQFTEMERALSRIQSQGSSITSFLAQMTAQNNN